MNLFGNNWTVKEARCSLTKSRFPPHEKLQAGKISFDSKLRHFTRRAKSSCSFHPLQCIHTHIIFPDGVLEFCWKPRLPQCFPGVPRRWSRSATGHYKVRSWDWGQYVYSWCTGEWDFSWFPWWMLPDPTGSTKALFIHRWMPHCCCWGGEHGQGMSYSAKMLMSLLFPCCEINGLCILFFLSLYLTMMRTSKHYLRYLLFPKR